MVWPDPDPTWHPIASEWYEVCGEVHPRPTAGAATAAGQWATAFSARIAADLKIPAEMVFEAEDALGIPRDEMRRHPSIVLAKLIYWRVIAEIDRRDPSAPPYFAGPTLRNSPPWTGRLVDQQPGAPLATRRNT